MSIQDLGKVAYLQKGAYNSSTKYEVNDVVTYQGSSYVSKVNNNQGNLPTNTTYWAVVVEKPVKGVDYFTPADKQEMVDEITQDAESEFNQNAQAKTEAFNTNASDKTGAFNNNATSKTNDFNSNASSKTTAFNNNATSKTTDYDTNASNKLDAYNSNHTSKLEAYNTNHDNKMNAYDTNATNKTGAFDEHVDDKTDEFDGHVEDKTDEFDLHVAMLEEDVEDLRDNQLFNDTEGAEIHVEDGAKARVYDFGMSIESSQETTTGKNLCPVDKSDFIATTTWVSLSNANANTYTNGTKVNLDAGTYTLNITEKTNINSIQIFIGSDTYYTVPLTFSIASNTDIYIRIKANNISNPISCKNQLEVGSTSTNWEPYTGGQPSPSPDYPQEVKTVKGYSNLFDKDNANIVNNLFISSNDNLFITSSSGMKTLYIPIVGNKTYTISKVSSKVFRVATSVNIPANSVSISRSYTDNTNTVLTITSLNEDKYLAVNYYQSTADTLTEQEILDSLMIVEGDQELPYVPYGNNYVNVKVTGKNLFKLDNVGIATASSGKVVADATKGIIIDVRTVDNLYISGDYTLLDNNMVRIGYFNEYPKVGLQGIRGNITTNSIINTTNYNYILLNFPKKNTSITDEQIENSFQIEIGSVATSYETYKESIVPLPLNGNEIAGICEYLDEYIVDKNGHCWLNKVIEKIVLDGTEEWYGWGVTGARGINLSLNGISYSLGTQIVDGYSTHFKPDGRTNIYNNINDNRFSYSEGSLWIRHNSSSTLADFKTWLSTHNTEVYYVLATSQLIDLNTTVDLRLFKGINNITNSEDANMKIRYVESIETVINELRNAILEIGGGE